MLRAGVNPEPHQPTAALVTPGPFRYTRNPIYLTFTLFFAGFALLTRNLWLLPLLLAVLVVMHYGVITREERYLARRFGDAYHAYCARVRRWL
jgi:protein-S-isoprenylcysteine O-methyltransferase Ste14